MGANYADGVVPMRLYESAKKRGLADHARARVNRARSVSYHFVHGFRVATGSSA